ncbi:MAG TPA: aldo/keto reductase [Anaerolineae bacterium]|nr:aldo/keto reductase [Anaerolineae bacterium]
MQPRRIGQSELKVFPIGLGTMGMSEFYGESDEQESIATIQAALDQGVNFFDTADAYGQGHNEQLVGQALKGHFHKVVLATKFGIVRDEQGNFGLNGSAPYVKQACEASLRRLGVETIDLYYLHRVDPQTPVEETVAAMAALVKEGKVRYLGLSEVAGDTLKRAYAVHPIAAVQSEYSLWSTDVEQTILPACRELGVSLVAYSPLSRGFLTGQIKRFEDFAENDYRRFLPRFQGENFYANLKLVDELEEMAAAKGVKASQLALAWVLAQGNDIIPIPGTRRQKYLLENIAAANISLTDAEMQRLNGIVPQVAGERYDALGMSVINQ